MSEYVYVTPSDRRFQEQYGLTPDQVMQAVDENRKQIARRLSEWGFAWAVDEIMANVLEDLLQGGLDRWRDSPDGQQRPLGAFVNKIAFDKLGAWMDKDRPKYRGGMTYAPHTRRTSEPMSAGDGDSQIRMRLHAETRAASSDRLIEAGDVFADTGDTIVTAPAGDKASYRAWLTNQENEDTDDTGQYTADLAALQSAIRHLGGRAAWTTLLRRCRTDHKPKGDGLRREVRHWIEAHHTGDAPALTEYPYIAQIINKDQT